MNKNPFLSFYFFNIETIYNFVKTFVLVYVIYSEKSFWIAFLYDLFCLSGIKYSDNYQIIPID